MASNDEKFHYVLLNKIAKDNCILPLDYNKAAYQAEGAFIIPHDPKDTDYADGQNWDVTRIRSRSLLRRANRSA